MRTNTREGRAVMQQENEPAVGDLTAEEIAALNGTVAEPEPDPSPERVFDSASGYFVDGPTPTEEIQTDRRPLGKTGGQYERSPERAVESLRRYTKGCTWVLSVDWAGGLIGIEIQLIPGVRVDFLRRLPNRVNGYRVSAYEENAVAYLKIGEDLETKRQAT